MILQVLHADKKNRGTEGKERPDHNQDLAFQSFDLMVPDQY
jgi:hypothetical protein